MTDERTILHALRTAADHYGHLASLNPRQSAQFLRQQQEAQDLAQRIEDQGFCVARLTPILT